MKKDTPLIGFIGQGWVGKHYADSFEKRGYNVVRYDITSQYSHNKTKLKECDIIFVAVPTPTIPEKDFDDSILLNAIKVTNKGQIVVIKSTVQVGITDKIQRMFPDRYILHSPEFLTEKTAAYDASYPDRNIVGYTEKSKEVTNIVMKVLPKASYQVIVPCKEAELVKYAGNVWFYFKVMVCNLTYDIAKDNDVNYNSIKDMMSADERIGSTHLDVEHQGGRGAGGHCFIKDLVAFKGMYKTIFCGEGNDVLRSIERYNKFLLKKTNKNIDLLNDIYEN